jgi:SAM-dependent methyltransferase
MEQKSVCQEGAREPWKFAPMIKHKPDPTRGASRALLRVAKHFSRKYPILDAGCGFGRNAIALAKLGFTVTCVDRDLHRLDTLRKAAQRETLPGSVFPVHAVLDGAAWPFAPACFSAIIFVHYLDLLLCEWAHYSLVSGGFLHVETAGGHGGNYLELPTKGELQSRLLPHFQLAAYQERPVGPPGFYRCAVKLLATKY